MRRPIADSPEHKLASARMADKYVKASRGGRLTRRQIDAALGREQRSRAVMLAEAADDAATIRAALTARATAARREAAGSALFRLYSLATGQGLP